MRITYIHQHFRLPEQPGGTRSWEFARRFAKDGHNVTVIAGADSMGRREYDGVKIVYIRAPYQNRMRAGARMVSFLRFLILATIEACRRPADIVFATSTPLTVAVPGMVAAVLRRSRFVFEVRDLWPTVPIALGILRSRPLIAAAEMLERLAYARADAIVALSPGMKEGVLQVRPGARVEVIPNASDIELFDLDPARRDEIRARRGWGDSVILIYAGGLGLVYGAEWLVDVAANLPAGIRILIAGDGSTADQLAVRARDKGLDPKSLLLGALPKTEIAELVAASDGVLSTLIPEPTLEACSLNKVFDAMAASRPIFTNHGGWLTDTAVSAGGGWRLDLDPVKAARELADIVSDRVGMIDAGRRCGELAHSHFSRDEMYLRLRRLFEDVAKPR